jgi:hypothetical protein
MTVLFKGGMSQGEHDEYLIATPPSASHCMTDVITPVQHGAPIVLYVSHDAFLMITSRKLPLIQVPNIMPSFMCRYSMAPQWL